MKIFHADADDWEGLYIDGVLVSQGHSFRLYDVMEMIIERGGHVEEYDCVTIDGDAYDEWLAVVGHLPEKLSELEAELAKFESH